MSIKGFFNFDPNVACKKSKNWDYTLNDEGFVAPL